MKEKQGNLAKAGLPKLLHLIYKKGDPAAILDITREPIRKRFFFKDGKPVFATSNILNEVLGRLLMQEGIITQKDYETSLELVLKEKRKHGQVLISMGLITPDDLDTFLTLQLKRRLWKIFGWNEGTYRYTKTEILPEGITHFPLHPASLILEGINLGFYPNPRIKSDLKDYLDRPLYSAKEMAPYTIEDFKLNLQEKRFLESFDGTKKLREAIEASDLLRHRAVSLALTFIITGLVKGEEAPEEEFFEEEIREAEVVEAPGDKRLNAELLFMRAKGALQKKDFRSAIESLREITDLNPVEGEYWAYLGWAVYNENPEKNIKEAEKILKDAIDLNNDLDSAWYFLGTVFLASNNTAWAERCFRTSIAKNPWMLEALSELKRLEIKRTLKPEEDNAFKKDLLNTFGFTEDPFAPFPDQRHLSLSAGQTRALELLAKAVKKRSGPVLLEGGEGVGKTTVTLELLRRLSNEKVLCAMAVKPYEKELQLIKAINAEAGSSTESHLIKDQLLSLGMRVSQNKIQGGHTLLVIDEAHLLTDGCLKLIQYLSRLKTLQILLVAEPGISGRLKGPDFKELDQKLVTRVSLKALSMDEARDYVSGRLNAARREATAPVTLTEEELKSIFDESGGVPALINQKAPLILAGRVRKNIVVEKEVTETREVPAHLTPPAAPEETKPEVKMEARVEGLKPEAPGERAFEERIEPRDVFTPRAQGKEEAKKEIEASADRERPEPSVHPPRVQAEPSGSFPAGPAVKKKKGILKLILIVILMLIAGLIVGSFIGKYWSGWKSGTQEEKTAPAVKPEEKGTQGGPGTNTVAPVEPLVEPSVSGSAEGLPPEGTK